MDRHDIMKIVKRCQCVKEVTFVIQEFKNETGKQAKPVLHIYTFALAWLGWSIIRVVLGNLAMGLYAIFELFVVSIILSMVVYFTVQYAQKAKVPLQVNNEQRPAGKILYMNDNDRPRNVDPKLASILNSEMVKNDDDNSKIILGAVEQIQNLQAENRKVNNNELAREVAGIIQVSKEILDKITKKPELLSSIQRFLNHYFPQLITFVADYHYMEGLSVKGENVMASMKKIEHATAMLNTAFQKQLDALFSTSTMNLEVDMNVLENILKSDGLIEQKDSMRSFVQEKEND